MTGVDESSGPAFQEVRLAVTMVGGVSLAIWMGGVAREISHVVQASRRSDGSDLASAANGSDPAPEPDQAEVIRGCYRELLELLRIRVSVDVLTGTSAGGINAACLGVAEGYQSTLADLRDVWLETGSFSKLLRDPDEAQPVSVLQGDKVMLSQLNQALTQIAAGSRGAPNPDINVILTSTMVDGETTRFTDALGSRVRDTEHRLLFRFDGDYWTQGQSQAPLALAARSTASFPAAFELSRMPVVDPDQEDELHPDSSRYANAVSSHWLTDGGVLLNKPLAPALRAIFERPAGDDVRRLMLYVAPTGEVDVEDLPVDKARAPLLGTALNRIVGAITSQTISAELEDLDRHNQTVVRTRGTRVSLARMGTKLGPALVDEGIMTDYRRRRVQGDATALVREAMRWLSQNQPYQSAIWAAGTDSLLIDSAAAKLMADLPRNPPSPVPDESELGGYRTTALEAAVGTGLQLIGLGFRLEPSNEQATILNRARKAIHSSRSQASRTSSVASWVGDQFRTAPPSAEDLATGEALAQWIGDLAQGWASAGPDQSQIVHEWRNLAEALRDAAPVLRDLNRELPATVRLPADLAQAWEDDRRSVTSLTEYLLPDNGSPEEVCGRLLALHVAERGLLAAPPSVDQRVDLVQVSADTRSLLEPGRNMAGKKLTGIQVHNFGAFYKKSWRANDWMWGRIDGAGWLVHTLLDPRRLRLLRDMTPDADGMSGRDVFAAQVAQTFTRLGWVCAGSSDDAATRTLLTDVETLRDSLDKELAFLGLNGNLERIDEATARSQGAQESLPVSMPTTALVLSRGIQSVIAADELPVVARAVAGDVADGANASVSKAFLTQFPKIKQNGSHSNGSHSNGSHPQPALAPVVTFNPADPLSAQAMLRVQGLFRSCKISDEKFETERGSQLLTRTIVQTAAVTVNAAAAAGNIPGQVQPALGFVRSATRSAWWVTKGANSLPRPWNIAAGAVTAMAGLVLADTGNAVLQAVGLASLAGGLIFVVVSLLNLPKTWKRLATILGVVVLALFLFAAFIPWIRNWWFDWLGGLTDQWRAGQLAWVWLLVAAFILLPALAALARAVPLPGRRQRPKPRTPSR
ncbi:MAG TPA: patatin-like protein [Dermatophilaceae bacterium]